MSEHSSKWSSSSTSYLFIQNQEETAQQLHIHILRVSVYNLPPAHPPPHLHDTTHIHMRTTVASSLSMSSSCYASMPSSFLYFSIPLLLYQVGLPHFVSLTPWPHISRIYNTFRITAERVIVNPGNHCRMNILQNPLVGYIKKGRRNEIGALFEGWRLVKSSFVCSEGFRERIREDDDAAEFQQDTSKQ